VPKSFLSLSNMGQGIKRQRPEAVRLQYSYTT
jgi:hypothetical protein